MPIRAKLLVGSAVLLVAYTLIYGYVAFATARDALLPSIREQLADDAINVKGGLEEMLTAHYLNVRTWARLAIMGDVATRDAGQSIGRFLAAVHRDYGVYLAVVALDREGVCVASSDARDLGRDLADTPVASPSDGYSDPEPTLEWSEQYRAHFVRLASPIPDPTGQGPAIGTLVAMLDREVLDRIVVSKPGHSHVELRLLDGEDRLLAGRDTPLDIRHIADWRIERGDSPNQFPPGAPPLLREGSDEGGRSFILAEVPIGSRGMLPTPGWHLVASVPKDLALAPVTAARDRVLVTGMGLVAFGLLAAAWLASRLSRPIKDLTLVAARIARSGDLEDVPSPRSDDEVGELARAFQQMVTAVATANEEMVRTSKLAFLGEMAAGMAHEFRTPLGIIRSSAQLLERRMDSTGDREAGEWAVFIREESDRLAKVVTELLEFVKPVPPMKTAVDLAAVARRAASLLSTEAGNRGVTVTVREPDGKVVVPCDADQIHQVCLNLLMNALQASPRGGEVSLTIEARGPLAALVVRDRGAGIPAAVLARLFEPFTSERDGGIGLGLAIVRRIVRAHGGEVLARNRQGGGAKLVVTLPVAAGAEEASES